MPGYRSALAGREFRRLFAAGLASSSGGSVTAVCLLWIVFATTHSAIDVGLVGTSELFAGVLFSLVGGGLVDRYDRRNLMVVSDLVRAGTVGALAVFLRVVGFDLPVILLGAFVISAFSTIFNPAEQTVVPAIVGPELIADANGLIRSTQAITMLAGASAGGVLIVTVGPLVGLAYNAATFLFSAFLLAGLALSAEARRPTRAARPSSFVADVVDGFRWLRGEVGLLTLTVSAGFFNFFQTIVGSFVVVYATIALHGTGALFGLLLAAQVGASGLGSLAVGRTGAVRWAGRAWVVFYGLLSPLTAVGLALFPTPAVAFVLLGALGFFGGFAGTAWLTAAQLTVPTEMQGRYFGVDGLGSWAILPAGQIGGGFLIAGLGIRSAYLLAGIVWLVFGAGFALSRPLARWGHRPTGTEPSSPSPR